MSMIKKFFEKRKLDVKFKRAGEGHRLDSPGNAGVPAKQTAPTQAPARSAETAEQQRLAAEAALARINQQKGGGGNRGSLRTQVVQEMDAERKSLEKAAALAAHYTGPREVELDAAPVVGRVLYRCALTGEDVLLPKDEMERHIEVFLESQLVEEPAMTSALMIYTLNRSQENIRQCVDTISKYLQNIAANPTEQKYQRIRASNKVLMERVLALRGAQEFLQAAGFTRKMLPGTADATEEFFVFDPQAALDVDRLNELHEILANAEPIRPELDRSIRVFHYSSKAAQMVVPDEFFRVSADEIRREQQAKAEAVEQFGMLRTRQMRERDRLRELRRYRYCLIRVRLPDGVLLQGTFFASDKLSALYAFVADCLVMDWIPFSLTTSSGQKLTEDSSTLAELELAPASLLNFAYDPEVLSEMAAQIGGKLGGPYLKPHLMALICNL